MNIIALSVIYAALLASVTVFSWGFVDANMPIRTLPFLYDLVIHQRLLATMVYVVLQVLLFVWYATVLFLVHRKRISTSHIMVLIVITVALLFFSFPGFSYDLFNYIATAKVTYLYRENPWLVMPIEIGNEPMLQFLHASNKVALYGFSWILLTAIPHALSMNNLLLAVFTFKGLVLGFYAGLLLLIWKISKSTFSLVFFALNPLITVETLGSGHNDVVMMFFGLLAFTLLARKRILWSVIALGASIFVKYATVFLLPVYMYVFVLTLRGTSISWRRVWKWSAISMYIIFLLSPLREEVYAWYLIWPLTFVALIRDWSTLHVITLGFSFGLPFRLAAFLYFRNWGGMTPLIKKLVTFIPPVIAESVYAIQKKK